MKVLLGLLNSLPNFLSYETFYDDDGLLREILSDNSKGVLVQNAEDNFRRVQDLPDLDRKVLSFVLSYMPPRIWSSRERAQKETERNPRYSDKYYYFQDFWPRTDRIDEETGRITYYQIGLREWTHIFNRLFDEQLREDKQRRRIPAGGTRMLHYYPEFEESSFWELGDELVKLGVGYWIASVYSGEAIEFVIPGLIYERIEGYRESLPKIKGLADGINEIQKEQEAREKEQEAREVEKQWGLEELGDLEPSSEVLESEIEDSIRSNPTILEEGLELVGSQHVTPVGLIDILCTDKNGDFVVVEIKRGKASHEVVGQIQKYMAWVSETVAKAKQTRGIIVAKGHDRALEYATKGSRFPIEIKTFGQEPPTEGNVKYCNRCAKPNRRSARYCTKCGQDFWMQ